MFVKLALRNVKRSAKDYLIYMLTLILSVGLFYGFLSITSPFYNKTLPIQMNLEYFSGKMRIIIPIIALLLVFLISYVNRYMIMGRKKEFALQIIIGMEQRTVAYQFFIEMLLMGLVAVGLGVILGVFISQIVSAIIMSSFGETFHLHFSVYPDTMAWTLLFFTALFILIGIGNVRRIRGQKIIDMLQDNQKTEGDATLREIFLPSLIPSCGVDLGILVLLGFKIIPFWKQLGHLARWMIGGNVLSAMGFLFCAATFNFATGKRNKDGTIWAVLSSVMALITGVLLLQLQELIFAMLRNGLISGSFYTWAPPLMAFGMILFSLIAFFSCLSWMLVLLKEKWKGFKYQNLFLLGQMISKLKTNSKTMAVLCCVFIISLVLLGWLPTFTAQVEGYLKVRSIYDVQVFSTYRLVEDINLLPKAPIDRAYLDRYLSEAGYEIIGNATVETYFLKDSDFHNRTQQDMPVLGISLSDYNELLKLSGHPEITLLPNTYAIAWDHKALSDEMEVFNQEHPQIEVGNRILTKAHGGDYQVNVGMGIFTSKTKAVYILPDEVCDGLTLATIYYAANTATPLSYGFAAKMDKEISLWLNNSGMVPPNSGYVRLKTLQLNEGISNSLMLRLGGAYTSLVLVVISLTILALQQLTDAAEHKQRFKVIEKIGVDKDEIKKLIRQQMAVWFGIPIVVALLGAGGVICYLMKVNYRGYVPYISVKQVLMNVITIYGIAILIIACYLWATYRMFKHNIVEE